MKIKSIIDIPAYQLCCGCGNCAYLWPENVRMNDVSSYGRRPLFSNQSKSEENWQAKALDFCPGYKLIGQARRKNNENVIKSLLQDWGPILDIWEGYASDSEIRFKGSSGGVITALCQYCLDHEKMAGVLHVAADDKRPYLNKNVFSTDRDSLINASGSRYSPASPCESLSEIENASSPCVLVGKPCDIAGANLAGDHKKMLKKKLGLTIACFCAGTPSTKGTIEMLRKMGFEDPSDLGTLRNRGFGWPGKCVAQKKDKDYSATLTYEEAWGGVLQKYRQWRCYICPDHTGEFADLAIGDPWYQETANQNEGTSLLVIRTRRGREIFNKAITKGYLVANKVDISSLPLSQPNLLKTRGALWGRIQVLKMLQVPFPIFVGFDLPYSWHHNLTIKEKLKSFYGTIVRVYKKRLNKRIF